MMRVLFLLSLLCLSLACRGVAAASASQPPDTLFDPARHMRVDEVRPGMKGYGLSVFEGTQIQTFDVEVLSVLENFNPKHDVILVRCAGANLEHTGGIAGMSGSPIYLYDDTGNARMVGAFAYGWPMAKDPVGGVQPIEYMLELLPTNTSTTQPADQTAKLRPTDGSKVTGQVTWRPEDSILVPWSTEAPAGYPFAERSGTTPNPRFSLSGNDGAQLRPLATPLMTGGMSPKLLEQWSPIFQSCGLIPLQAGGGGARVQDADKVELAPGSAMAVPLLLGDADLTAIGTVTEVIDDKVFGFGHPFMSQGPIQLPMGTGLIHGVIANLESSFKLGGMLEPKGTLYTDQSVGIAGSLGTRADMIPIDLRVVYSDGSLDERYRFTSAMHPRFTPLISVAAVGMALNGDRDLPEFHTLNYDLTIEFENGQTIQADNIIVNASPAELLLEVGAPMIAAANNPFEQVLVKQVTGTVTVTPHADEATILSITVPRLTHRPGETVQAYVTYRPFRGAERTMPITFDLPRDLPEGKYNLAISDWEQYLRDEEEAKPFRFVAESAEEVFAVMRDLNAIRHDALYVRLVREEDGVAVGRTAMPRLPASRREIMLGGGRSNTTAFVSSDVKTIAADYVMSGSAEFEIEIDRNAQVEKGAPRDARPAANVPGEPAAAPTNVAAPKSDTNTETTTEQSE